MLYWISLLGNGSLRLSTLHFLFVLFVFCFGVVVFLRSHRIFSARVSTFYLFMFVFWYIFFWALIWLAPPSCLYFYPLCKIQRDVYWICASKFHNGSKTWADLFFKKKTTKHVNLEYNKYKLRTAFDETKRSSHLLHFCDIVLIPQMFAQLAWSHSSHKLKTFALRARRGTFTTRQI